MDSPETMLLALRRAARELMDQRSIRDLERTLSGIVEAAVETVPGVDAGGISMTEHDTVVSRAPTDPVITKLDRLQSELHEGPCISAIEQPPENGLIGADDLAGDDAARWPRFAPLAVEAGYRSILSTTLNTDGGVRAALNLYGGEADVFDAEARMTAGLFGVEAALLLYGSQHARYLQQAVDSRDVIGQAKGLLMERFAIDDEEAFRMLVRSSQDTNMKLVNVAGWLKSEAIERARARRRVTTDAKDS